jgi:hypothetical protein
MSTPTITSLPLGEEDRAAFVATANEAFEAVLARMEPDNVELTRKLWNAEEYVDTLLREDMQPIERDYALSLLQPFLVEHVANLAAEADALGGSSIH